jgi:hypothetical protein
MGSVILAGLRVIKMAMAAAARNGRFDGGVPGAGGL